MFADLVDFTSAAARISPRELIEELTGLFNAFDGIVSRHGAERIKTIGDAYLAVCGMPIPSLDHAQTMVRVGLDFLEFLARHNREAGKSCQARIGVHTGPVIGGIVGRQHYLYDIFGDAVNTAVRVQSAARPMSLLITPKTYHLVKDLFPFTPKGLVDLKGRGPMELYEFTPA